MIEFEKPASPLEAAARYREALAEIDAYAAQWRPPPPRPAPTATPFPWLMIAPIAVVALLVLLGLLLAG